MFQTSDLESGWSVFILDFSDKKIVSFKIYNVTRKFYEYSDYTPSLKVVENSYSILYQHSNIIESGGVGVGWRAE